MKTIKEILILVKKEFNKPKKEYPGLCRVGTILYRKKILTKEEYYLYDKYIRDSKEYKEWEKGERSQYGLYVWKKYMKTDRNKWMNKHIALN